MSIDISCAVPLTGTYHTVCTLPPATWEIAMPIGHAAPTPSWPVAATATPTARGGRAGAGLRMLVRFAGFELDCIERQMVAPGGGTERLPGLEFALLQIFLSHPRELLSRADLARQLTRDRGTRLSGRTVDSYVSRLRRRLARAGAEALIETVRTTGYRFAASVARA